MNMSFENAARKLNEAQVGRFTWRWPRFHRISCAQTSDFEEFA